MQLHLDPCRWSGPMGGGAIHYCRAVMSWPSGQCDDDPMTWNCAPEGVGQVPTVSGSNNSSFERLLSVAEETAAGMSWWAGPRPYVELNIRPIM